MLHRKAVEPIALELLNSLMKNNSLQQFVLVGETALALQIGHRKSIDLDLFTIEDFDSQTLLALLLLDYNVEVRQQLPQTIICNINSVKVDFIRFRYPFIRPVIEIENIRLLSIEDIAPMKLDAITGRGSKKDFYDLYFLLELIDLNKILGLYQEKYPHQTLFHVLRSLVYFDDAEENPTPLIFDKSVTWSSVKNRIIDAVRKT
ncbi:MAG: nucleotidyl transferase AbiEii/AbiGii toxin family protein [Sphingobacteriales bacterium]|nr:MAG: nucleotidyl transferase AbiEii/AbiGii toxin family protein [Sphingobacteriales bacterium]